MKDLESELLQYLKERHWHKLRPSDIAKSISIEAAELLELFQWTSLTIAQTKKDKEKMEKIKDELADVLIYCLEMAALLRLDAKEIIRNKLERARQKYPANLMRKSQGRSYPGTGLYLKIKAKHRKENRG